MRRAPGVAALALIGAMSVAAPARAQHVEGRFSLTASGSYNTVISDSPYPTALTLAGPSASLSPSGVLLIDSPRTENTLSYALTLNVPFTKDFQLTGAPISYSNRFSYSGRYELSERTSGTFLLSFAHTPQNVLGVSSDPTQTLLDPVPSGARYLLALSIQQGLTRQLSPSLSLQQTNGVNLNDPVNPLLITPKAIAVQNAVALSRSFAVDTVGFTLSVGTTHFTVSEGSGGAVVDPRTQITNNLALTWSRPLTTSLSLSAQAGATQIISPATATPTAIQPSGSLTFNYRLDPATLSAGYSHMATPNLLTSTVNFTDSATLRFSLPIGMTGLSAMGSGGFTHMEPLGASTLSPTNTYLGDVSLTYHPTKAPTLAISARIQVSRQSGGSDALGNFTRFSTALNLTYSYPSALAAMVAPPQAPSLGSTPYVPGASSAPSRMYQEPAGGGEAPAPEPSP